MSFQLNKFVTNKAPFLYCNYCSKRWYLTVPCIRDEALRDKEVAGSGFHETNVGHACQECWPKMTRLEA